MSICGLSLGQLGSQLSGWAPPAAGSRQATQQNSHKEVVLGIGGSQGGKKGAISLASNGQSSALVVGKPGLLSSTARAPEQSMGSQDGPPLNTSGIFEHVGDVGVVRQHSEGRPRQKGSHHQRGKPIIKESAIIKDDPRLRFRPRR